MRRATLIVDVDDVRARATDSEVTVEVLAQRALAELGIELVEWHDEDMLTRDELDS